MNIKTMTFGLLFALIAAIFAAALTIFGTRLFPANEKSHTAEKAHSTGLLDNFFSSSDEDSKIEFVEVKNIVITLQGNDDSVRYLLLELSFATNSPANTRKTEDMAPAIRGATVSLLSDMNYDDVRAINIATLREKLLSSYSDRFKALNTRIPFQDVIISKMVFQ